jgi:hypothetical protein
LATASTKTASQLHRRWMIHAANRQSDRIFTRLTVDPSFYREFDDALVDPV